MAIHRCPSPKPGLGSSDSRVWRDTYYHRQFGLRAARVVERLLPLFERECPRDDRPRQAMEAIRAWARGKRKLGMPEVRRLSLGSHAAARQAKTVAARFVAHAAGHAVGTWHVPTHALAAFFYAGRAFTAGQTKRANPKRQDIDTNERRGVVSRTQNPKRGR
jgi:hypothetical protein